MPQNSETNQSDTTLLDKSSSLEVDFCSMPSFGSESKEKISKFISTLKIPFSEEQKEAIYPFLGITAIIATAGAGKTATMSASIACLLKILEVHDHKVLATTFTNAASDELKTRIDGFLGRGSSILSGTMHHFCLGYIRKHFDRLGFAKSPTLIDERQRRSVITGVIKEVIGFVNKKEGGVNASDVERCLMWNEVKKFSNDPNDVLSFSRGRGDIPKGILEVIRRFEIFMTARSYMDMDNILSLFLRLLILNQSEKFMDLPEHIFIDEAQDLSAIQWMIVETLSKTAVTTTIIGDDDQSIYYFRGATPQRFRKFAAAAGRKLFLSTNRRCSKHIVQLAKQVIDKMSKERRLSKDLTAARSENGLVRLSALAQISSIELIAQKIKSDVAQGKQYSDFSIIARSTTKIFPHVEGMLKHANIPYRVYGGRSAFDMPEVTLIKNMLAIYSTPGETLNKRSADALKPVLGSDFPTLQYVHLQNSGTFSQEDILNFGELITGVGSSLSASEKILSDAEKSGGMLNSIAWSLNNSRVGLSTKQNVMRFIFELSDARSKSNIRRLTLSEFLEKPVVSSLLRSISENSILSVMRNKGKVASGGNLSSLDKETTDKLILDRKQRYEDLLSIYASHTLSEVHDQFNLRGKTKEDSGSNYVTVTTCHSAKGLEWDTVFIAEANQNNWPSSMIMRGSKDTPIEFMRDSKDEEHRLFYVAITRAKNNLFLVSTANDPHTSMPMDPTEFLPKKIGEKFKKLAVEASSMKKSTGAALDESDFD